MHDICWSLWCSCYLLSYISIKYCFISTQRPNKHDPSVPIFFFFSFFFNWWFTSQVTWTQNLTHHPIIIGVWIPFDPTPLTWPLKSFHLQLSLSLSLSLSQLLQTYGIVTKNSSAGKFAENSISSTNSKAPLKWLYVKFFANRIDDSSSKVFISMKHGYF